MIRVNYTSLFLARFMINSPRNMVPNLGMYLSIYCIPLHRSWMK